jgi:hypothetical protein
MRRYAPIFVLVVLATFIGEVLFGATPVSRLGGLVAVTPLYGGGAVLIRELARRRGSGWGRIALLAAAYAIVEEGLALQSMFNPNLFNAGLVGGTALGVNWVWVEWTIGYHIIWSITVPILLTELLFPARRAEPWLGRTGLSVAGIAYAIGALALAAIFRMVIAPNFHASSILLICAALAAAGLAALALFWPVSQAAPAAVASRRNAPSPWLVGLVAFVIAGAWFGLLDLPHSLRTGAPVLAPILAEGALAAGFAALIRRWSGADRAWTDLHRLALACGALLVSMLVGFFFVTASNPIDQLGQGGLSVVTIVLLALYARRLQQRDRIALQARQPVLS